MPIYTYRCKNAHTFDKIVPMADADKRYRCPECGAGGKRTIAAAFDSNPTKTKEAYPKAKRTRFTNW